MDMREYLNKEGIRWMPIGLEVKYETSKQKQVKILGKVGGYQPKCTDFKMLSEKEIETRQNVTEEYEYIAHDTNEVHVIDVDLVENMFEAEMIERMKTRMPYYESASKGLPHFLFKSKEKLSTRMQTKYEGIEILAGGWAYSKKDAQVYNIELGIPELDIRNIVETREAKEVKMKQKKVAYEQLERVVNGIDGTRSHMYDEWRNVVFAIMQTGIENGYKRQGELLAHRWSSQNPKYDEKYLERKFSKYYRHEKAPGYGTLCMCLKEDNPKEFRDICACKVDVDSEYETMKGCFEKTTHKIMHPVCYVTEQEGEQVIVKERDLTSTYRHMRYDKSKGFIKRWLDDPEIKRYGRLDFVPPPQKVGPGTYNIWTGFKAEQIEEAANMDMSVILNHILILCNHDTQTSDYLIKWLAHIIQKPGELSMTAIVLKSDKGVGKNIFTYFLREILGESYYAEVTSEEQLFGRFANARKNRLLINVEEINVSFSHKDRLKNMITSKIYNHETKGIDPIPMQNYNRFMFTTNNEIPVPIEVGDRRMVVISADNTKKNDNAYFEPLIKFCNDSRNVRGFYEYLKAVSIENINWVTSRPLSEEYYDIQSMMVPMHARFLHEFASEMIRLQDDVTFKQLYMKYREYLSNNGYNDAYKSRSFALNVKGYEGIVKTKNSSIIYRVYKEPLLNFISQRFFI